MPYPTIIFSSISDWENYLNTNIITNGIESITGLIGNNAYNGAVTFIKKSPINWGKAAIYAGGGDIDLSDEFLGAALFTTVTPDSLTFGDNFYKQYVFFNMTSSDIPLGNNLVYYNMTASPIDNIGANSIVNIFKATNDLWVGSIISGGGGGGSVQKEPKTYIVGPTPNSPISGTNTWTLAEFANSYVVLFINGGIADQEDAGDGTPYITKTLSGDTLTLGNYSTGWVLGDKLNYILITP